MKLLFLTQVLDADDAILGFVPRWVQGLAARCEAVRVVALEVGATRGLPATVDWREIGRKGRVRRFLRYRRVLAEAFAEGYDAVLAHMVPRYALVAAGPARRAGAGLFLWYTHGAVDRRLERAVALCDRVFTATEESMRVPSPKKLVTGHGIDVAHFDARERAPAAPPRLVAVGRLSPAKDPLTVLAATSILVARGFDVSLDLVGAGLTAADEGFRRTVGEQIEVGGLAERVHLLGAVPYGEVPVVYRRAACLVNASHTGSLDKVVLEAMASGLPFVSCNDAVPRLVAELGADAARFVFPPRDADGLAEALEGWLRLPQAPRRALGLRLRAIVVRDHEVDALMERLVGAMEEAGAGRRG